LLVYRVFEIEVYRSKDFGLYEKGIADNYLDGDIPCRSMFAFVPFG
jgi:hypothetical protein